MVDLFVGARVRVTHGPLQNEVGVVSRPVDPKRSNRRVVDLDGGAILFTSVDFLEPLKEQPTMQNENLSEVEVLARESSVETYVDEERPTVTELWSPSTIEEADWALSRLLDAQTEQAEIERLHAAAVARLEERKAQLLKKPQHAMRFFEGSIRKFAEANRKELLKGGKAKSRKLMFGELGWKKTGGQPVKTDEKALLEWARSQPVESEFLRVKEEPNWSEIKKAIAKTGEAVPGTDFEPESETFYVKPAKE